MIRATTVKEESVRASNHEVLGLSAVEEGIERSEHTVERCLIAERVSQD